MRGIRLTRAIVTGIAFATFLIYPSVKGGGASDLIGVDPLVVGQNVDTAPYNRIGGGKTDLKAYRGKKSIVLAFWLNHCNLCIQHLDQFKSFIGKNNRSRNVVVVSVARADKNELHSYNATIKNHKFTFPVINDPQLELAEKFGVNSIPTYILIDRGGRVASKQIHNLDKPIRDMTLYKMIDILSAGKQIPPIQFEPYTKDKKLRRLIGSAAPKFELASSSGKTYSLNEFSGKMNVVLVFWHPYSAHCKSIINVLNRFYSREKRQKYNFVILSASSIHGPSQSDEVNNVFNEVQPSFPFLIDSGSKVGKLYSVEKIPTIFIISRNGKIYDAYDDYSVSSLENRITAAFDSMNIY